MNAPDPRPRDPVRPTADGAAAQPRPNANVDDSRCLLCGAVMYGVHCKRICPNCGYREDCSDLFPAG